MSESDRFRIKQPQSQIGGATAVQQLHGSTSLDMGKATPIENTDAKKNLYLYQEDMKHMPSVATYLKNFALYHVTYPSEQEASRAKKQPKKSKLGVVFGVYLPTIQHVFGVLMFVRLAWMVGCMGVFEAFAMVFLSCLTTILACISLSAIATNGVVQAGGSYYLISRTLGPECGASVGLCFYLANIFAVDLYSLGCIEIFLQYMAPGMSYFGDIHHDPWNNFRVYGTVLVIFLTLVVAVGVKFVQYFAPFSLACVIISILSIFIGAFEANSNTRDVWVCLVGEKIVTPPHHDFNGTMWCTINSTGDLWDRYCGFDNSSETVVCDPYFINNNITWTPGIPGMFSGIIKENLWSNYMGDGESSQGVPGNYSRGEIVNTVTISFVILTAIYFPSVTGIMTGSNMSGDLKDPQYSIPIGTILAQLTTSFVYLSMVVFYGATGHGALLRDKFGASQGGTLYAAQIAWPNQWIVLVGAFCSTLGAALQCLTSAPRLLQAIARDHVLPCLDIFTVTTKSGEPLRALWISALIAEVGILIANLDVIAPVLDVFFLMCYGVVNLACALQTLMRTPNWRPRYKYYHWTLSFLGLILNLALAVMVGWLTIFSFLIAAVIYKLVEYVGAQKEWGDGITGLSMSAAQKALLKLDEEEPHTKNWRPQLLVMVKLTEDISIKHPSLFSFAKQLKAGKGFSLMASVLEGSYVDKQREVALAKQTIRSMLAEEKVEGFVQVLASKDVIEGLEILVQTAGLGGMKPNTVVIGWPYEWRDHVEDRHWKVFLETVRTVTAREYALLCPRFITDYPCKKVRLSGTIDVWWIVHDGGLLILLSFLLQQHKVWKNCKIRIFTVAQMTDNSIQMKKDLEHFLYQLRIEADVFVEEMYDSDISAYTVERTLDMEKRQKMLAEMKLSRRSTNLSLIQEIVDANHHSQHSPESLPKPSSYHQLGEFYLAPPDDSQTCRYSFSGEDEVEELQQATESMSDTQVFITRSKGKLLRMHTALRLNQVIRDKSRDAQLVVVNFPAPPNKLSSEENYMEYLDALSEGINRCLLVRGSGREVITMYS